MGTNVTKLPWTVGAEELPNTLRGNGGQTFVAFMNALLRAEGAASGVRVDDIQTNIRVNIADGGVDAEVKVALLGPLGLNVPTAWQFKATSLTGQVTAATLREEATKAEAKRLIEAGYAYYFCVCDDAPADKMAALDKALLEIVREINPNAPVPRVLNAGHLADWASRHPSVVLQFFRQHFGQALAYEPWLKKERAELPVFVDLESRTKIAQQIRTHVAIGQSARAVLSIGALSGAGASRLVAETLAEAAERVICVTQPGAAIALATSLLNQPTATAILVVDRCNIDQRRSIEDLLRAESGRLRVITIQDPTESTSDVGVKLRALKDEDVQRVLDANFREMPFTHRHAFVQLADGMLKIAATLAKAYQDDPTALLGDATAWAHDELQRLVRDEKDGAVLRAISLFHRVGYKGEVEAQLGAVCKMFGLIRGDVVRRCARLAATPGVANVGPRYLSVRPRLFARPLFEAAWMEVVGDDIRSFIETLPSALRISLLRQAAMHAANSVRDQITDWAMPWVRTLVSSDLESADVLERLIPLADVSPTRIGRILSDLAASANDDEARAAGERFDSWPARMHVIWALRRLLHKKETFEAAERALYRLARAEGSAADARQSSSATERWASSFRIYLSGTEVPFMERLAILAGRLESEGSDAVPFVVAALGFALDDHSFSIEAAPILSGEVRPSDWQPRTYADLWECQDQAIALLGRCLRDANHRHLAFKVLVRHGRALLHAGGGKALRAAIDGVALAELERVALLGAVDDFLAYDAKKTGAARHPAGYVESIESWRKDLSRTDLGGRVLEAASADSYRRQVEDKAGWEKELDELAQELLANPEELERLLPSLTDSKSGGAPFEIGYAIGKRDTVASLIPTIFAHAVSAKNPLFMRGYIVAIAEQGTQHDASLAVALDVLEAKNAEMAVDLNGMAPRTGSAGARAIRLVRAGRLPPATLTRVFSLAVRGELLADSLETILDVMRERPEDAAAAALKILGPLAWDQKATLPTDARSLSAMWRTLEIAVGGAHAEAHSWGRVLRRLSEVDFERAVQLASKALVTGDVLVEEEAACELSIYAGRDPLLVLKTLGPMVLDSEEWRFANRRGGVVLNALPLELLQAWITEEGVLAARAVAAYLPRPYLDAAGKETLPPLTEFVLEKFESDDDVFSIFASAAHNGQVYSGDIPGQHEREASVAEKFRSHRLRRIREWADREVEWGKKSAQRWREYNEESFDD